jgi:U2 small nuclear ribonucleoprotein A'
MVRLTLELLQQAPQSLNPASQRQLLLRGFKIPSIENLGGTNDAYECIDLSDNDLIKLGNFPPLKRLKVLLLANNRVSRIAGDCFDVLPQLMSVTLTGNKIEKLVDLEPLTKLKTLERLSLLDNPVTKVKHYRPYMINKCGKSLRILDFNKIKDKERKAAGLLFAGDRGKKLLEEIAPARAAGKDQPEKAAVEGGRVGPSPEVIERIKKAIAEAETIEEVTRLEKALKSGVLPEDLQGPAAKAPEKPEEQPAEKKQKTEAMDVDAEEKPAKAAEKMDVDAASKAPASKTAADSSGTSQYKEIAGVRYERNIIDKAVVYATGSPISKKEAQDLWERAMDGHKVTETERRTLEYTMKTHKYTESAKKYMTEKLAGKDEDELEKSGTSQYKTINKVKYERDILDKAAAYAKDGQISKEDAEKLWKAAMDGNKVTLIEKRTLEYTMKTHKYTDGAKKVMEEHLATLDKADGAKKAEAMAVDADSDLE